MNNKKSNPTAILTSDWHLRETTPTHRIDDYYKHQWYKVQWIADLQEHYDCDVWHAGDLFHHWKPSPRLLTYTLMYLPEKFYTIYGNHDLPGHTDNAFDSERTGIAVLLAALRTRMWYPTNNANLISGEWSIGKRKILFLHQFTYQGKSPWPGCEDLPAIDLLKKYPDYDLILIGDNHQTFVEKYDGRLLINPGSLMRMTTAQIEHKPCIFLWYADTNEVEQRFIPIKDNVFNLEYLENEKKRNNRINAFIEKLNTDWNIDVSFKENLKRFFKSNKINDDIKDIIWRSLK